MSLVQYPDSDSDSAKDVLSAQRPKTLLKRKRSEPSNDDMPPLPAAFHDLYSTNARVSTSDNPSLHGGRVPSQTESDGLHSLIKAVKDALENQNLKRAEPLPLPDIIPSLQSELGAPLPLHVSLSRTLQIKTDDRESFRGTLNTSLRRAAVQAFHFDFRGLKWVPNYERNRWFLVLGIKKPAHDELNRLLSACNEAAQKSGHPALYSGGKGDGPMESNSPTAHSPNEHDKTDCSEMFHISIAWNLIEPDPKWISLVRDMDVDKHIHSPQAAFDVVKARVGNVVHNFDLITRKSSLGAGRGSLGLG
ncbi:poly(U)-specific 3'-to-5' RNA exonuclease [Didymella heteroderae]|uniref:U6 snRNA phosphodiesterase n=1 Tax=Didymella heteroderae TaxID=1769908 RepID=A0A9P4WZF1_9PLEO|nr:poly(U)-specific 3'-to-5' RNA exonuclease [Didymella heteroderae]